MKDKIMLHIEAYQLDEYGNKEHVVSLDTIGLALETEEHLCLEYEETELIGVKGTTTQICLPLDNGQKVIVKRKGASSLEQVYVKGQKNQAAYETPYGKMEIEIFPRIVKVDRTDTEINIKLGYDLMVSGQYVGQHHLNIAGKLNIST